MIFKRMKIELSELRKIINEVISEAIHDNQEDFNDAVNELMKQPEYKSLEAFIEMKFDNDEESFDTIELQALARNLYLQDQPKGSKVTKKTLTTAPASYRDKVKQELSGYGIKFSPRAAVKQTRGFTDPFHGKNRFAGNHGGSGFENEFNQTPSSKRTFDLNDPSALGMGAKRKKNESKEALEEAPRRRSNELAFFTIATKDEQGREMYLTNSMKDPNDDGPGLFDKDKGKAPEGYNWTHNPKRARVYSSLEGANSGLVAQKRQGVKAYIKKLM